jgi:hypothetical protein
MPMKRAVLCLLGIVALISAGHAEGRLTLLGFTFPAQVGGATAGAVQDYESSSPGLGYRVHYERPGWNIDAYIYDFGLTSISDGAVRTHLDQAKKDIRAVGYDKVEGGTEFVQSAGAHSFRCAAYKISKGKLVGVGSLVCLAARNNKFIKLRVTALEPGAAAESEARSFVAAWGKAL